MTGPSVLRVPAVLLAAVLLAACEVVGINPLAPAGSRTWVIPVENGSARPAILAVAEDGGVPGRPMGTANPSSVAPGARVDVMFTVPAGTAWAIFVNGGPQVGPLISAQDVPAGAAGRLPLTIRVQANGDPSVEVPSLPGWFGN